MASQFDESDFVDSDYQSAKTSSPGPVASVMARPPTREELDTEVGKAHQKLAELKRIQDELERERAALEEARRRRIEFQTGREEMLQNLTRGIGLLEKAEFTARSDAEQMTKTLSGLREALTHVQAIREESWNQENWNLELTRALTSIENSRMEWNGARLKWPVLSGQLSQPLDGATGPAAAKDRLAEKSFGQLCKMGLALTWPIALIGLVGLGFLALLLLRR